MRHRYAIVALCLLAGGGSAVAQGDAVLGTGAADAERARIAAVRAQKTAELDAEDAVCLTRFAVTGCQSEVGQRRRQMLGELKRQEDALNAVQRQQKGAEQLRHTEEKAQDAARQRAEADATAEAKAQEDRQQAQDDKRKAHQQQATSGTRGPGSKSTSQLDAQDIAKNREAYLEKQKALEKRRQERDQRIKDHGRGGPPLPSNP